jgi:hypothetical protein
MTLMTRRATLEDVAELVRLRLQFTKDVLELFFRLLL